MSESLWPNVILGDPAVATTTSGGTPSRANGSYFGGEIHWIKSGDLNDGHVLSSEENITNSGLSNSSARLILPNAVLIAMYGATVGKTGLLKIPAASNQAVCAIQASPAAYNPQFLQYLLISRRAHLLNERYGGAQPNISQAIIRALELPCPEVFEQEKIAALLWKTQRAAELEEKLAATARELKSATMRRLFSAGLHGEPQKESEIGLLPQSWDVVPLGTYLKTAQYGLSVKGHSAGEYPILRMNCQQDGHVIFRDLQFVDLVPKDFTAFRVSDGDLLFNRTNSYELVGANSNFPVFRKCCLCLLSHSAHSGSGYFLSRVHELPFQQRFRAS